MNIRAHFVALAGLRRRSLKSDALNARFLIVGLLFLASACVLATHPSADLVAKDPDAALAPAETAPHGVAPKTQARASHAVKRVATRTPRRVSRFVNTDILNVRAAPDADAPVVARLTKGTMFSVVLHGEWAQLGDGQYALSKFLSAKEPRPTRRGLARN